MTQSCLGTQSGLEIQSVLEMPSGLEIQSGLAVLEIGSSITWIADLGALPICTDLSGISASDAELVGISRERGIIEHRLLIMIMRVWDSVWM